VPRHASAVSDIPPSNPYHLYGLKKGRFWYYREQDIREHEQRLANLPKSRNHHRRQANEADGD